jgi:hypothetical protein
MRLRNVALTPLNWRLRQRLLVHLLCALSTAGLVLAMSAAAALAAGPAAGHQAGSSCTDTGGLAGIPTNCPSGLLKTLALIPSMPPGITKLEGVTAALALGIMGAIATIDVLRALLVGVGRGSGGAEVVESMGKSAISVVLVLAWAFLFTQVATLANDASTAVLNAGPGGAAASWLDGLKSLSMPSIVGLLNGNPVGWIAALVVALLTLVALVGVLMMNIGISATTIVLYAAGPLAIALRPISGFRNVTDLAEKGAAAVLVIRLVWALLEKTFSIVGTSGFSGWTENLSHQIIAIALLYALIAVPRGLLREATAGAGAGGGVVRQTVSFSAASVASHAAGRVFTRTVERFRGPQATVMRDHTGAIAGYSETSTVRGRRRRSALDELQGHTAAMAETGTWREPGEQPVAYERRLAEASRDTGRVSTESELDAHLRGLPIADQRGVQSAFRKARSGDRRDYDGFQSAMAAAAAAESLPAPHREAYRALAAADPRVLEQRFGGEPGPSGPDEIRPIDLSPATRQASMARLRAGQARLDLGRHFNELASVERADVRQQFDERTSYDGFRETMRNRAGERQPRAAKRAYKALAAASDASLDELLAAPEDAAAPVAVADTPVRDPGFEPT